MDPAQHSFVCVRICVIVCFSKPTKMLFWRLIKMFHSCRRANKSLSNISLTPLKGKRSYNGPCSIPREPHHISNITFYSSSFNVLSTIHHMLRYTKIVSFFPFVCQLSIGKHDHCLHYISYAFS